MLSKVILSLASPLLFLRFNFMDREESGGIGGQGDENEHFKIVITSPLSSDCRVIITLVMLHSVKGDWIKGGNNFLLSLVFIIKIIS